MKNKQKKEQDFLRKAGAALAQIRKAKALSQIDLAEKSGVMFNTISNIERGETDAKLSSLKMISRGLGIELYQIFGEMEYTPIIYSPRILNIIKKLNHQDEKTIKLIEEQADLIISLRKGNF